MTVNAKPKALLLRDNARPNLAFEKVALVLQKLSDAEFAEAGDSETLREILKDAQPDTRLFLDEGVLARTELKLEPAIRAKRITIVAADAEGGACDPEWLKAFPHFDAGGVANADLPRLLQLALNQEASPGIFALADKGSEIFYEKVKGIADVGAKVDRLIAAIEKKNPELQVQAFNLRQLSFAILHHAFAASPKVAGIASVVDFQASVNEDRVAFATAFSAPAGAAQAIVDGLMDGSDPVWRTAWMCADALVVTEVRKAKIVEAKALLAANGKYSSAGGKTLLFRAVEEFVPDATSLALQKGAKLLPLVMLGSGGGGASGGAGTIEAGVAGDAGAAGAGNSEGGPQLNYKLKADMLENERSTLQGLVKKKNHLITELNKDVNRAQREAMLAKNSALKELREMRLEVEKAQRALHQATEKAERLERQAEESKAKVAAALSSDESDATEGEIAPPRDLEKELKAAEYAKRLAEEKTAEVSAKIALQEDTLQKLRRELDASKVETNEAKAKLLKLEKSIEVKSKEAVVETKDSAAHEAVAERMREMQKQLGESRLKEQELDKEVKRLTLKLEGLDQSAKATQSTSEKKVETMEKQLEEAKRKVSDVSKKLEDERAEAKTQTEEWKQKERELKKKADDLTELVRLKVEEAEKAETSTKVKIDDQASEINELKKKNEEQQKKLEELAKAIKAGAETRKAS